MQPQITKIEGQNDLTAVLRGFRARRHTLDERHDELVLKYPDRWVALTSNGTLIAADTVTDLVDQMERKGLTSNDAAVRFMATIPKHMIL